MRNLIASAALLTATLTTAAAGQGMVLYETNPWVVSRQNVSGTQICVAKVEGSDRSFQLIGSGNGAGISIGMANWHFTQHKGSLMLKVDDAGMGAQNAEYDGNFVNIRGATDVIYVIMRGIDVPGSSELEVLGDDNKVIATFDVTGLDAALKAWKACVDAPEVLNMLEEGVSLINQNNLQGAIDKFDAVIKADPTITAAYIYRGRAELQLSRLTQARADIEAALAIEPKNRIARVSLGEVKSSEGDYAGAVADFTAVLEQDPTFLYAVANRGNAYAQLGDYAAAAQDVALIIRLVPSSAATYRPILADDLFRAGQYEAAAAEFHSLAADPKAFGAAEFMISEFLSAWHAGRKDSAELARNEARLMDHKWPYPLFGYLLDRTNETALLASLTDKWAICEAKYIIGQKNLLEGKTDRAYRRFKEVVDTCPYDIPPVWLSTWYVRQAEKQE